MEAAQHIKRIAKSNTVVSLATAKGIIVGGLWIVRTTGHRFVLVPFAIMAALYLANEFSRDIGRTGAGRSIMWAYLAVLVVTVAYLGVIAVGLSWR